MAADLVLTRGTDYFALDTSSNTETFLAAGSLDTSVNYAFEVEAGIAYQGGFIGGQSAITATNLTSGATQDFILPGGFFRDIGGFHNGDLVIARDDDYYGLDTSTGTETLLATGSLDTVINFAFEIEVDIAYQGGTIGTQSAISATNLTTGASQGIFPEGGFFRDIGGFHNGDLVIARDDDYYAMDTSTGLETFLASGSLDTVVNYAFVVEDGVAYQGGTIGGQTAVTATDLSTDATQEYILVGGFFSELDVFDPIPEPNSSALILAGVLTCLSRRRRRSSKAPGRSPLPSQLQKRTAS